MNKKKFIDPTLPPKEKPQSRHKKSDWKTSKNGYWNTDPAPWGFNCLLGYCEQSQQFNP